MRRRTKEKKHDLFREICEQLEIKEIKNEWFSAGSSVTADAFKVVLYKFAEKTGIPPRNLSETGQLAWRLLHKSHEAMLQALQTINNPTLIYRLESFLFLFINSWELLLKARILDETKKLSSIQFSTERTISIDKALDKIFKEENDPIKENILAIEELRNEATHMVIPIIPTIAVRLFQAGIFNYNKLLYEWFGRQIDEKAAGSMMFLISSLDPNALSIDKALLSKKITKEVALVLKDWESKVAERLNRFPENMQINSFAIPIEINISLIKNPNKADILATLDDANTDECLMAIKYQRPIDKYPFSSNALMEELKKQKPELKQNKVYSIIKELGIKKNSEYSIPNFLTKQSEEKSKKTGIIPSNIPYIYNKKALELILTKL